jgi:hypothetical protein
MGKIPANFHFPPPSLYPFTPPSLIPLALPRHHHIVVGGVISCNVFVHVFLNTLMDFGDLINSNADEYVITDVDYSALADSSRCDDSDEDELDLQSAEAQRIEDLLRGDQEVVKKRRYSPKSRCFSVHVTSSHSEDVVFELCDASDVVMCYKSKAVSEGGYEIFIATYTHYRCGVSM